MTLPIGIKSNSSTYDKIHRVLSIAEKDFGLYEVNINIRGIPNNPKDLPSKLSVMAARILGWDAYLKDAKKGILNTGYNYETIEDIKTGIIPEFNNIEDFTIIIGCNFCSGCWEPQNGIKIIGDSGEYYITEHKEGISDKEVNKIIEQLKK